MDALKPEAKFYFFNVYFYGLVQLEKKFIEKSSDLVFL